MSTCRINRYTVSLEFWPRASGLSFFAVRLVDIEQGGKCLSFFAFRMAIRILVSGPQK
jgi:hypothetical protein